MEKFGDPDVIRMLYGMPPLSSNENKNENLLLTFKQYAETWVDLGRITYAPWITEIANGIKNGTIPLHQDESVGTVLQKYIKGFRENGDLYWMGLLRRYGNKIELMLPE